MGLLTFVTRRMILLIPVLLGVTILIFVITMLFPPATRASIYMKNLKASTVTERNAIINETIYAYGLNNPFYVQYFTWLGQVLQGNLGWSMTDMQPVIQSIMTRFPATLEIVLYSAPIIVFVGIFLGVQSAVHRDKMVDHVTRSVSIMGWSLPSFWLGMLLITVFYLYLGQSMFSPGRLSSTALFHVHEPGEYRQYTGLYTIDGILNGQLWITADAITHLILPIFVLVTIQVALLIRVMRSSMLEALSKPYIIAAKAKGLTQKEVINKHARRNALIPVVTLSGLLVGGMLTGLTITETVFGLGGLGAWAAAAALGTGGAGPDIPSVLAFAMLSAIVFVVANLVVDVLYAYIDPRIRLA
jgi:dipeptide transport system permease protein